MYGTSISFSAVARIVDINLWCSRIVLAASGDSSRSKVKSASGFLFSACAIFSAVSRLTVYVNAFRSVQEETSFAPEPAEDDLSITRVKQFYFRPMTREEAVLQMNLLGHNFFAFRDEDNGGCFAVVYRRESGGYGLLDDME